MSPPRPRLLSAIAALACLGLLAAGVAIASFTSTTQSGLSIGTDRVFPGPRTVMSMIVSDAADGSAADATDKLAVAEGKILSTSNFSSAFAANRWLEFVTSSKLPAGVPTTGVALELTVGASAGGKTACYYVEVYRESTGTLLATYGSSGTPVDCIVDATPIPSVVSLPVVTSSDVANDLRIRIYGKDSGSGGFELDRAVVTGATYKAFTLYTWTFRDQADTSLATTVWGAATADSAAWRNGGSWASSFSASRYVTFLYDGAVPDTDVVSTASFTLRYRSRVNGSSTCWYFEAWSGGSLIGSHGSSGSTISCNASNTTWQTDTVSMSEVNTPAEANDLIVKIFFKSSGADGTEFDEATVAETYLLGTGSGCTSPYSTTVDTTADTYVKQDSGGDDNFETANSMNIKSNTAASARRVPVYFPLPPIPIGCAVTAATLNMYASAVQGTRTLDAYAAASQWSETAVVWNTKPATTGSPASRSNTSGWEAWTVTSIVQGMYAGSNNGFVVKDSAETSANAQQTYATYDSGANWPTLDLTFG